MGRTMLVGLLLVLGCGDESRFPAEDASGGRAPETGVGSACGTTPLNGSACAACLRERCCPQLAACSGDAVCVGCFRNGRYTACAGRASAENLIVCSVNRGCGCYSVYD